LPGPVMRPVTSPWPRSPGRWVSGVAPSTGRCSRRPDRNPRDGYRDSSSAESSAPRHRRPRTYPLDLSSGLLRPLVSRRSRFASWLGRPVLNVTFPAYGGYSARRPRPRPTVRPRPRGRRS
jgi:hypothetical protein